eukprot:8378636-Pyramimonas_sp.AAC.1
MSRATGARGVRGIRIGGEAAGERPWYSPFVAIYGSRWWKEIEFQPASLFSFSERYLRLCGLE